MMNVARKKSAAEPKSGRPAKVDAVVPVPPAASGSSAKKKKAAEPVAEKTTKKAAATGVVEICVCEVIVCAALTACVWWRPGGRKQHPAAFCMGSRR